MNSIEKKSRRVVSMMRPSDFEFIKSEAQRHGVGYSDIVRAALDSYRRESALSYGDQASNRSEETAR